MSGHPVLPAEKITLPLLPLRDVVVFPHMVIPLFVGRPKSIKALEVAMEAGRQIMLVAQKAAGKDEPKPDDMFEVGCVSSILQMQPTSNMSSGLGSSLPAAFCATSMIWRPASMATSSALIDFGRPTNSGITMWGNTTTSRNGSSGSVIFSAGNTGCPDMARPHFLRPMSGPSVGLQEHRAQFLRGRITGRG